ncbi:MAG: TetR/AcrR family transcriptional regulator [Rhodoferax sp.]|nr:TetR/AcrR family transcriptional regulator [Rhodoferax sp.]
MTTRPLEDLQTRSVLRRREILDAALACFTDKGVEASAIEDICSGAGASVSSVYHLFGNKAGVAAALYLDSLAAFQAYVCRPLKPTLGAKDGVLAFVAAHIQWADKNKARASYLQAARHTGSVAAHAEDIRALNRAFFESIAGWARPHIASAQLRALPADLFMAQLLGPTHEYVRGRLAGRASAPLKVAMQTLGESAWRALGNADTKEELNGQRGKQDHGQ